MADLPKRPRDLNQWEKLMVHIATSIAVDKQPMTGEQEKDRAAVARGRAIGSKGSEARVEKLSPEERLALARRAVQARWNRPLRQNRRSSSS
jgi:hypothetical protein